MRRQEVATPPPVSITEGRGIAAAKYRLGRLFGLVRIGHFARESLRCLILFNLLGCYLGDAIPNRFCHGWGGVGWFALTL